MANTISSIDEAVDCKFLVVKDRRNQVKAGTLVHIMSATPNSLGYEVGYRVTGENQNFNDVFSDLKDFNGWAKQDSFIARYYDLFDNDEIMKYIKVNRRTVVNFSVPIIVIALIVIWLIFGGALHAKPVAIVFGVILSLAAAGGAIFLLNHSKNKVKMDMYKKIGSSRWGVNFK
ncbi:MAG: hypothetical protein K6G68_01585 [Oscillospiraceae bacterium]|nr:hypothetical protein [Oscillospiraceae bacterium]MBQ4486045.1 hypothetical protein [Oscillospiraceae bacterium]MCR5805706.1 hypothetical protein [Oscillospiraceae bacterium]